MRALILSISDARHMTMISPYIEYLRNNNIDYDIIRANRYDNSSQNIQVIKEIHGDIYEIKMTFRPGINIIRKIIPFMRFRIKAIKIMESKLYDYIVVWNENTAALFSDYLVKKYVGRYCINIRDWYPQYLENWVIKAGMSAQFVTFVSPEGREFNRYRKGHVLTLFNHDMELRKKWRFKSSFRDQKLPIRITHMGFYCKALSQNKILDLFGNDERFILQYYGDGFDEEFLDIVERKGYKNVQTAGPFSYEKTIDYLAETDIINSYYNYTNDPEYYAAFGIKQSYTPLLCIPGMTDENTFFGRISKQYGLAYLINEHNIHSLPDDLYRWYRNLDFEKFTKGCNAVFDVITKSKEVIYKKLDDIFKK